jgi:hypothetical protein
MIFFDLPKKFLGDFGEAAPLGDIVALPANPLGEEAALKFGEEVLGENALPGILGA